jgi:hypothetical protein
MILEVSRVPAPGSLLRRLNDSRAGLMACFITASTSRALFTLWPIVNFVGLGAVTGAPASSPMSARLQHRETCIGLMIKKRQQLRARTLFR